MQMEHKKNQANSLLKRENAKEYINKILMGIFVSVKNKGLACLVGVPRRPAPFCRERREEWIWGRGRQGVCERNGGRGNWSGCTENKQIHT